MIASPSRSAASSIWAAAATSAGQQLQHFAGADRRFDDQAARIGGSRDSSGDIWVAPGQAADHASAPQLESARPASSLAAQPRIELRWRLSL